MKIQELINELQNAIDFYGFDPNTTVQIDMLCENLDMQDTYWNISVDDSGTSEPRSFAINVEDDDDD